MAAAAGLAQLAITNLFQKGINSPRTVPGSQLTPGGRGHPLDHLKREGKTFLPPAVFIKMLRRPRVPEYALSDQGRPAEAAAKGRQRAAVKPTLRIPMSSSLPSSDDEEHVDAVGVITALERTCELEARLRQAIQDTHPLTTTLDWDFHAADREREALLAIRCGW